MAATIQTILKPTRARGLDTSGNNNHAQIYSGRALEFDGITDSLTVPETVLEGKDWRTGTIATWIYLESLPDTSDRICSSYTSGTTRFYFAFKSDGRIRHQLGDEDNFSEGDNPLQIKTWYRIVLAWNVDGTASMYINGVLDKTHTGLEVNTLNAISMGGSNVFSIGAHNGTTYLFNGKMSDFQMWNSTWTADDVTYDYLNPEQLASNRGGNTVTGLGTQLTESNLKLWYPMNDGHRGNQSYILDASNTGLGNELVTNGDFSNGTTGWTLEDEPSAEMTVVNKGLELKITDGSGGSEYAHVSTEVNFVSGKMYKVTLDILGATLSNGNSGLNYIRIGTSNSANEHGGGVTNIFFGNGSSAGDSGTNPLSLGTTTLYYKATSSHTYLVIGARNDMVTLTIDNVSVKTVNDKNNATTVFYGDEMVANGDSEVTDPATVTISGVALAGLGGSTVDDSTAQNNTGTGTKSIKVLTDGDSAWPGVRWVGGDEMSLIVGRTYYMECYVYGNTGGEIDRLQLKYRSNDGTSVEIGATSTLGSWQKLSGTFTIPDDITDIQIIGYKASSSVDIPNTEFFYIDDISLKEVGVASGWTDADQQLDIPQTALQSYNQLGWIKGEDTTISIGIPTYTPALGTGSFTLSYSLFAADLSVNRRFMAFNESGGAGRLIHQLKNDGSLEVYIDDSDDNIISYQDIISSGNITAGKWYHIVESFNRSSDELVCYLNGETQVVLDISTIDANLNFGSTFTPFTYVENIHGSITEIAMFKGVAFSSAEVVELYNNGKILDAQTHSQKANLNNYWRNNGLATWTDLEGSDDSTTNNITETMLITAGVDSSRDSQGFLMNRQRLTNSLNLATNTIENGIGSGERAVVPGRIALGTADFSISFWVYKHRDWDEQYIIGQYKDDSNRWLIRGDSNSNIQIYAKISNTQVLNNVDTTNLANHLETWTHFAVTVDRSDTSAGIQWYVNGAATDSDGTDAGQTGTSLTLDADTTIGWFEWSTAEDHHFDGTIDDLLIYGDKLEATEVKRIYNAGKRSHK